MISVDLAKGKELSEKRNAEKRREKETVRSEFRLQ